MDYSALVSARILETEDKSNGRLVGVRQPYPLDSGCPGQYGPRKRDISVSGMRQGAPLGRIPMQPSRSLRDHSVMSTQASYVISVSRSAFPNLWSNLFCALPGERGQIAWQIGFRRNQGFVTSINGEFSL